MKYLNIFFIIIFLVAAFLQWNDPDPALWIAIYLAGAYLCFTALRREINTWIYSTALCLFGVLALYLFFVPNGVWSWLAEHNAANIAESMNADRPWIERTREFFGLLIIIVALGINMISYNKRKKKA